MAFKVGDLGIFVCTRAVVSYMGILFHSRSVVRVTFQSLGMSVFWVKNEKCLVSDDNMQWYISGTPGIPVRDNVVCFGGGILSNTTVKKTKSL